jgi:hypothetical protein
MKIVLALIAVTAANVYNRGDFARMEASDSDHSDFVNKLEEMRTKDIPKLREWLDGTVEYLTLLWRTNRIDELTEALEVLNNLRDKVVRVDEGEMVEVTKGDFDDFHKFMKDLPFKM